MSGCAAPHGEQRADSGERQGGDLLCFASPYAAIPSPAPIDNQRSASCHVPVDM